MAIKAAQEILEDLPRVSVFEQGSLQRKDIAILRERVAREVVVNAMMHRNVRTAGSVKIIRYSNRIEIRNPGRSLVSVDYFGKHESVCRNETIGHASTKSTSRKPKATESASCATRCHRSDCLGRCWFRMRPLTSSPPCCSYVLSRPQNIVTGLLRSRDFGCQTMTRRLFIVAAEMEAINSASYRSFILVDENEASDRLRAFAQMGLLRVREGRNTPAYYVPTEPLLNPCAFFLEC